MCRAVRAHRAALLYQEDDARQRQGKSGGVRLCGDVFLVDGVLVDALGREVGRYAGSSCRTRGASLADG